VLFRPVHGCVEPTGQEDLIIHELAEIGGLSDSLLENIG